MRKLLLPVAAVVLGLSLSGCTDEFKDNCNARQGILKEDSITTVAPAPGGGVGIGVATVRYCIIDGKIDPNDIEIG